MTNLKSYTIDQRREAINQVIPNKRDREILSMRLIDGMSYQEIGDKAHLSVRRIGVILSNGSAVIGDYLESKNKKRFRFF